MEKGRKGNLATESNAPRAQALERALLTLEISEFLYAEAELLDERCFDQWLDLFTDDAHYWMPLRQNVPFGEQQRENTSHADGISWFDEGKATLKSRVDQIKTGQHWAEEPLSRICHMVSNVQILNSTSSEVTVKSRMLVYRNRLQDETDLFIGKREDVLRKVDHQWKIAKRKIILDQNVLLAKNVTVFF